MPRFDDLVVRPRVRFPGLRGGGRRPTAGRPARPRVGAPVAPPVPTSLAERTEAIIEDIRTRYAQVQAEYFQIGKLMVSLDRPEVLALYGMRSLKELLSTHVIPYPTARRYVVIARAYEDETVVVELGIEKAFQLARLAALDPAIRRTAEQLAVADARLGAERKRVSQLTAEAIEQLVRGLSLRGAQREKPKPTRAEKASVKRFRAQLLDAMELENAEVAIDAAERTVTITVPLDELLEY